MPIPRKIMAFLIFEAYKLIAASVFYGVWVLVKLRTFEKHTNLAIL